MENERTEKSGNVVNYFAAHVNTLSPLFLCGSNQPSVTLNTNPQESKRIPRVTSFQEFGKKNSKKSDPLRELILKNAREYLNATEQHSMASNRFKSVNCTKTIVNW